MRTSVAGSGMKKLKSRSAVVMPSRSKKRRRPLSRRLRQVRALAFAVLFVLFVAALWSYVGVLTAPGSSSFGARTIEWVSNDVPGGRPAVLFAERLWYRWTAPPAGGTPAGGLPRVAAAASHPASVASAPAASTHLAAPAPLSLIAPNSLPLEGQWQDAGRTVGGWPAVRVAYLRPDVVHTSLVAGVMWLDTKLLRAQLVPGTLVPSSSISWPGMHSFVPVSARSTLAATFNSGFLLRDSGGGWYGQGKVVKPLVDGKASLVIYKDGTISVAQWGRDQTMTSDVAAVRQNLQLIVDQGRVALEVGADNYKIWGKTLGNTAMVWRSGLGVTSDGAVVYAAGKGLSVASLADVLQRAGVVRAMELDINSQWTSANYYEPAPKTTQLVSATKLLPDMVRSSTRFLAPDERDFVALFVRSTLPSS